MIELESCSDELLQEYDAMMVDTTVSCGKQSELAMTLWSDALRTLNERGKVELVEGSYDHPGGAHIRRSYLSSDG